LGVWSLTDWATALAGEVGEACNVIKKLRRRELPGPQQINADEATLKTALRDEVADALSYLDLLAAAAGFTLESALVKKFNEVSDRVGSSRKLPATELLARRAAEQAVVEAKIEALEDAAKIADGHWPEDGHVHPTEAVSCQMSISILIRRLKAMYQKRLESLARLAPGGEPI
jgi:NTP pyrophosphatase (non-canonical NTP hydrolase)